MTMTRRGSAWVFAMCNALGCVVGSSDGSGGTETETGTEGSTPGSATSPNPSSGPTVADTSATSDSDPTTDDDTDDDTDSTTGDPPVPVGTVAELLVPFDANVSDLEGPGGWSTQYGKSPEIVPVPRGTAVDVLVQDYTDGPNGRALVLRLEALADDYVITAVLEPAMLDRVMGLARDDDDNLFVASGVDETDTLTLESPMPGEYRSGIVRVVKQSWDGSIAFDTDLDTARQATGESPELLINPMVAATSRLAWGGGRVALVHGINTDTDWAIEARHQKALTTHLDATSGDVVRTSSIWVSHSFDQRIFHDGTGFLELHLGDAYPRDVVLARVEPDSGSYSMLAIKGDLGWNNTYTRLGNAVPIDDPTYGYLALFATESTAGTEGMIAGSRELGLVRVRRDFETVPPDGEYLDPAMPDTFDVVSSGAPRQNRLRWLTSYEADTGGMSHAERPKLVALGDGSHVVLWERWDGDGFTFAGTWGMVVDATGEATAAAAMLTDSHLPRGDDAFALGGEAAWITGDATARALHLHVVDGALAYRRIVIE